MWLVFIRASPLWSTISAIVLWKHETKNYPCVIHLLLFFFLFLNETYSPAMGSQSHRQHSDVSCWIPSCPPVAVQRDGGLERPFTQPLHLRGSALAYWLRIISRWSSTALAVNSGVNRLQHVPWSWLSPPVNKSRGLFFPSLSLSLSLILSFCLRFWQRLRTAHRHGGGARQAARLILHSG